MREDAAAPREKKVKRGKSQAESAATTPTTSNGSVPFVDCFLLEEEEAQKRDSGADFQLFKSTCNEIRGNLKKVLHLSKSKKSDDEIADLRVETSMLFLSLKKLNRLDKHRCKKVRDSVNEVKLKVDNFHLQLQNLLYETIHLEKEVTKCLEFRSKDEEIELVPIEEFRAEAPGASKKLIDPHQLTLARLEWELEQRKRLSEKLQETESMKHVYLQGIDKKKECLDSLQPTLKSIMEVTQPLHSQLGMPLQVTQLKHKVAALLPRPLYVLYVQSCAYKEACDKNLSINIEGNVEEAKLLQTHTESVDDDSGDSDQEESAKAKRHRSISEKRDEPAKKTISRHPLWVSFLLKTSDCSVTVQFYYLIHFNVLTAVVSSVELQPGGGVIASDVLKQEMLLNCLFPKDDGKESPNPSNRYQLEKLGFSSFEPLLSEVGYPYLWAQRLAGLDFLQPSPTSVLGKEIRKQHAVSASFMECTVKAIRNRLVARVSLHKQLLALEENNISIPPEVVDRFPSKLMTKFKHWTGATWEEITAHPSSKKMLELNLFTAECIYFKAVMERGSAKLTALVVIHPDYPAATPVMLLSVNWKGLRNSHTDSGILELEQEVNIACVEFFSPNLREQILSLQMQSLLVGFDIFLETESGTDSVEGPREFSQAWAVTRLSRGRNRGRPFKFVHKLGLFTHR